MGTACVFAATGKTVLDSTTPAPGDTLAFAGVTDQVLWAFTQVGVDQRLITGWSSIPGGPAGGRGTITFNTGQSLPAGYIVSDVELVVRAMFGAYPWWTGRSRVVGPPGGGTVTFPGAVFGAAIISHGIGTPSQQVDVRYFHSGFIPLDISVNLTAAAVGGGGGPAVLPSQIAFLSAPKAHWDVVVGGKGNDMVNSGISEQGGADAKIDNVEVELLDSNLDPIGITARMGSPDAVLRYGSLEFAVVGSARRCRRVGRPRRDSQCALVVRRRIGLPIPHQVLRLGHECRCGVVLVQFPQQRRELGHLVGLRADQPLGDDRSGAVDGGGQQGTG